MKRANNPLLLSLFSPKEPRSIFGRYTQQRPVAFGVYDRVIHALPDHRLRWICEIGTGSGVLSLFFAIHCYFRDIPFLTIDNQRRFGESMRNLLSACNAEVREDDCWSDASREVINRFIGTGSGLLFCDGGDKKREVAIFGSAVGWQSLVIVHDWNVEFKPCHVPRKTLTEYEPWHTWSLNAGTKAGILRRFARKEEPPECPQ